MVSAELAARRGQLGLHPYEVQANRTALLNRADPLLLLCRMTIELAFVDALKTRDGRPTSRALDAVAWIEADLDWTRRGTPPPPHELRGEYLFSFCHLCSLLNLDPTAVRRDGLVRLSGLSHRFTDSQMPGLPGIRERWREAREQHERTQQPSTPQHAGRA